ncbi:hypothetical protein [Sphingobacterium paucimobilis]|uniref:Uncharacterized protein n=1 Tax=Sphingobacterium paucimobilis HER1398 TaxID=1346330 RepID=U2HEF6_9SPHI|nr:hypothetical protein [Sphingobacterium paucimobilis]ERJ60136.1 hypothetical protein M472_15330 [Sphingobacterium paucimobilis HER1398]
MRIFFCYLLFIGFANGQTDPKKGMIYDKENRLYYKISNDKENLYIQLFKEEYARKVEMRGGLRLFLNSEGRRDTSTASVVQYPVYKKPTPGGRRELKWEEIVIDRFSDLPVGVLSVYNEYGITAEAQLKENPEKGFYDRNGHIFNYRLGIPLQYMTVGIGEKIAICIFLKGSRFEPLPPGAASPLLNAIPVDGSSTSQQQYFLEGDTWTHSWIDYELK